MAIVFKFHSSYILISSLLLYMVHCEKQIIDSLEILESLSQLALLRHHPQSIYSNNMTESFFSLLEDLKSQNLTVNHPNVNCSSLSQYPLIPKGLCTDGALFKVNIFAILKLISLSSLFFIFYLPICIFSICLQTGCILLYIYKMHVYFIKIL